MLGPMLTVLADLKPLGIPFGYWPGSIGYEVSLVLVGSIGLAIPQYIVLRTAASVAALPATAWAAITILVVVGGYAAIAIWVSSPRLSGLVPSNVIQSVMSFPFAFVGGTALGLVLWRCLRVRSAVWVWPAAWLVALAMTYAVLAWGPLVRLIYGLPLLATLLIGNAMVGGLYGAVTGVALVALCRRRTAVNEPVAPALR